MVFEDAVKQVLKDEGGFFHNPKTGEVVNHGITLKFMKNVVDKNATEDTIKKLTEEEATKIYKDHFWSASNLNLIKDPKVASLLFYLGVNMGTPSAAKLAQTACFYLGKKVSIDGVLGPASIEAINAVDAVKLHAAICNLAESRYKDIAANPIQAANLQGWLKRLDRYVNDPPVISPIVNIKV